MHLDPTLLSLVYTIAVVLTIGLVLQLLKQPQVLGYLLAGIAIGPFGLALFTDVEVATRLGSYGVVLLLFFVGMEVAPKQLAAGWRIAVIGTLAQVAMSVAIVVPIGLWLDWTIERTVLLGFVISLSSTAVIIKLLSDSGEIKVKIGQDVLSILLVQDLVIIPMLIVIGLMGGTAPSVETIAIQIIVAIVLLLVLALAIAKKIPQLPYSKLIRQNHELQVFAALLICMGFSLLTGLAQLSTALGAFVAGILVTATRETQWVHKALEPFQVIFIALFFVSIGLLVDLNFIAERIPQLVALVSLVLVSNTLLNGAILHLLGYHWRESLYAGAILAQIGEFAFVLAAVGLNGNLINEIGYQYTIATITLSLLLSPFWIRGARKVLGITTLNEIHVPETMITIDPAANGKTD
ncbi:MAG: CPA2 family monovalent cation:H+ antiporter-2 [Gammaproteobacteria bacterium]|jgi:CPA2 family monovalent cation:H+ antiporter-2